MVVAVTRVILSGWTALHEAVLNGHYEACVDLIKAGAVVNAVAHNGVTPLHDAIRYGHKKVGITMKEVHKSKSYSNYFKFVIH